MRMSRSNSRGAILASLTVAAVVVAGHVLADADDSAAARAAGVTPNLQQALAAQGPAGRAEQADGPEPAATGQDAPARTNDGSRTGARQGSAKGRTASGPGPAATRRAKGGPAARPIQKHRCGRERKRVLVLVPASISRALAPSLRTYRRDVEARFRVCLVHHRGTWSSPADLRRHLRKQFERRRFGGAVFVGDLPMHQFFMHEGPKPNPLYYEDFTLKFRDTDADGVDDVYSGVPAPKFWVANIRPRPRGNATKALVAFFAKTHAYYDGRTAIDKAGVAVTGDDWPDGARWFADDFGTRLFGKGRVTTLTGAEASKPALLQALTSRPTELTYIQVHSGDSAQWLADSAIESQEIAGITPGSLVMINHGCYVANWVGNLGNGRPNTAMSWVFGKGVTQALVGNVRSGMVYEQERLYAALIDGKPVGDAYLAAKRAADGNDPQVENRKDISGLALIGNPFLTVGQ
jgi:hypothetical protein